MSLDLLDRKIMYELNANSRSPVTTIAKKLRISKETVNFRINRLTRKEYIKLFYTLFNAAKLGYYYYDTFIKFNRTTPSIELDIANHIMNDKSCANLRTCEGSYDIVFLNMVKSPGQLREFFKKFKDSFGEYILHQETHIMLKTYKLNQQFHTEGEIFQTAFTQAEVGTYKLSEIDRKIIQALSTNARVKFTELAEAVGTDPKVIKYHFNKLEKDKVIVGYTMSPDFDRLGLEFVQISIGLKNFRSIPSIIEFFYQTKKAIFVFELLGRYDLTIELAIESDIVLKELMEEFKQKFPEQYNYYDLLHIYKEHVISWSPFEVEE